MSESATELLNTTQLLGRYQDGDEIAREQDRLSANAGQMMVRRALDEPAEAARK